MLSIRNFIGRSTLALSLALFGCSDSGDNPAGPGANNSLKAKWQGTDGIGQLFTQRCSPCHISQTPRSGGLDLSSYTSLRTRDDDLTPGDSLNSYLLQRLRGLGGSRMPQGGPYLENAQLDSIAVWIQAGAPNN